MEKEINFKRKSANAKQEELEDLKTDYQASQREGADLDERLA